MWTLTEAHRRLLNLIESDKKASGHLDDLCETIVMAMELTMTGADIRRRLAALEQTPEEAMPDEETVAMVLAISWIEAVARAVELTDGRIESPCFDADGLPVFVQVSDVFSFAAVFGLDQEQVRRTFREILATDRRGAALPYEMVNILGAVRILRFRKRRESLGSRTRLAPLPKSMLAKTLYAGELARAKSGTLFYSLFIRKDGRYDIERQRRGVVHIEDGEDGISVPISELLAGFTLPMDAGPLAEREALRRFTDFLEETGIRYQRLVYPTYATA